MAKRKTKQNIDMASIANQSYNERAGAQKNMEVGRNLQPLDLNATTKTTSAATARALPAKGMNLAVYNNASSVGSITLGTDATVASLAPGVCANGSVGIPCAPNDWTYIACWDKQWVIASAATLLVFLIADESDAV